MLFENSLINGDCLLEMQKMDDESVDLIFADPPYFMQLENELLRPNQTVVKGVNDEWDKFASFDDYDKFTIDWLTQVRRIMKKNAGFWVIGSYHNIYRIGKLLQDMGFWIINDILWIKTNPMPNFKGTRYNNAHETLLWVVKDKKAKYTFHYKSMKLYNDDLQMRSDWYIPICGGKEHLKDEGVKVHSTQKPEELLYRIIISTSNENDIVLDPFSGTGTTLAVAKKLKRRYIGIEKNMYYVQQSKKRLQEITPLDSMLLDYKIESKNAKVPFGTLVSNGIALPGDKLYDKSGKISALIKADSSLEYADRTGSIHAIGAFVQDKKECNGWTFWYIKKDNDELICIDRLRKTFLQEVNG